ncbi:MAG TPA: glycosyltransferase family 4 protein [Ktedonobacteraceae bacterium]|jgi:glycosyltransferase involved in cell wall biosynthesis|nr:glycosyltransferase family 4 protein [Ktedonobacteraceae bacterium]
MAHILFITPYYPPEKGAAAVRISETATRLVRRGHQVTVLTTLPNYPTGIVPKEYRGRLLQEEELDGVRVVRVWSYVSPNRGFVRRVFAQFSFGCLTPLLGGKEVGDPDLIILESHPLFNAIAGRVLARRKHCPFIFMVSDLWPASAVALGALRNRMLIRFAEWIERSTYQRAGLIWALSAGIRDGIIQCGISPERVFLLTNGADLSKFYPLPQKQARTELGWDDRFTVLYAGNFGLSHGLTTVLEAAKHMQDRADIHFILLGDGAERADLLAKAQKWDLKNVTFLDAQPHDRMPLVLAGADVCLVPMRNLSLFEGRLPLKMFEVMACARPILLGVEGEARRLAEQEARAAIYVEPENAEALVAGILYLQEHPEEAKLLGLRGRAYVEARYNRDQLTAELDGQIARLLGAKLPVSASVADMPESLPTTPIPDVLVEKNPTY